jgi:4-amino-4-deoxy-L-arabinose transferase-like glycosyltransferase
VAPVTTPVGNAWQASLAQAGAGAEIAMQSATAGAATRALPRRRARARTLAVRAPRPELAGLMALAATLNLWALSRNGWANDYYSAAVRSMSSSWHNFLFGSLDASGVMTVDKPPLALWVQSLSVRVFGYHPLSILVPQALIGIATVALVYDLVRRRFGRLGGFVGGLALALTPITVGISRHNNPDALLALCCVAALWFAVRGLEAEPTHPRTRWLVLAGVAVGLGFETKMAVALMVVPGIVAAWLWADPKPALPRPALPELTHPELIRPEPTRPEPTHPRGRLRALWQLLAGGGAMVLVGGAWPLLVELTPASDRPWISGTSDNRVLSLISEYNGVGRLDGQTGGPGGMGGTMFGGTPGPLRLLNSALGGQAGWLLGFALVSGLGILAASRLRRSDPRSGWLLAVGGSFLVTAVVFSEAKGIFHPYYVSLLAPFAAALVGAGAAQLLRGGLNARIVGPPAVVAGVASELTVLHHYPGQLTWLPAILVAVGAVAALSLAVFAVPRVRLVALAAMLAALLLAPATWAVDTLGYATNGTFPAGGPKAVNQGGPGGFGSGPGGRGGAFGPGGGGVSGSGPGRPGFGGSGGAGSAGGVPLFGPGGASQAGGAQQGSSELRSGGQAGGPPAGGLGLAAGGSGPGGPGGGGGSLSKEALSYVKQHGGGTIAVESQSSAASGIIGQGADVAGIGGFSGRESDVTVAWLAGEVSSGHIRWVLAGQSGASSGAGGGRLPGDIRAGSRVAIAAAAKACRKVTLTTTTLYDCQGRAAQLLSTQQSKS